ncbi:MAG: DHH family phosphoesterase [Deferribacteraceae bacterium]|nr:DHH family phosphoesterase [Deferribacteraceae bacterium]
MIDTILDALARKKRILILVHNNPDPDAMSAALGMKHIIHKKLKKKVVIAYMGVVGRLENRELVRQCSIDMQPSFTLNFKRFDYIILVDTQPQAGNVYIPDTFSVNAVIDHHLVKKKLAKKDIIADVRPDYGSCSTIVTEYMQNLHIMPDKIVATALYYGIITDVIGQARDAYQADQRMLGFLFPYVAINKLKKIENPDLPRYHFKNLKRAIENSVIIDFLLFCDLGDVRNVDLIAETADYLTRMREVRCVFVMGKLDNIAYFSLRYKSTRRSVGLIAIRIVKGIGYGGGHTRSAGGQIPLSGKVYSEITALIRARLLKSLAIPQDAEGKPI